jgi:hypothetical protein
LAASPPQPVPADSNKQNKNNKQSKAMNSMKLRTITSAGLLLGSLIASPVWAGPKPEPANQCSQGSVLDTLQDLYWRSAYGDITLPTDQNTNAVVGKVVMMPVPPAPGDGTPGTQAVTLQAGQRWFLPLWTLSGTSYTDGTPPDPFEPDSVFQTLEITFTIDGKTVVSSRNVMRYYSKFEFDPVIPLENADPYAAIIWFQGIGILQEPLCPGHHTLTLHAKNTQLVWGSTFEYNNTWNVTVKPKR